MSAWGFGSSFHLDTGGRRHAEHSTNNPNKRQIRCKHVDRKNLIWSSLKVNIVPKDGWFSPIIIPSSVRVRNHLDQVSVPLHCAFVPCLCDTLAAADCFSMSVNTLREGSKAFKHSIDVYILRKTTWTDKKNPNSFSSLATAVGGKSQWVWRLLAKKIKQGQTEAQFVSGTIRTFHFQIRTKRSRVTQTSCEATGRPPASLEGNSVSCLFFYVFIFHAFINKATIWVLWRRRRRRKSECRVFRVDEACSHKQSKHIWMCLSPPPPRATSSSPK